MADVLVLAAPMYNFAIPSSLKSWFDHVLRAGLTFRYAEQGPEGLLQGKRAFVLTARGGIYAGGGLDHQEPYLRQVLGFVGIHDVTFIHAEGMNMGPEFREKAWREPVSGCGRRWKPTPPFASLCQRSGDWTQHPVEPLPRVFDRVFYSLRTFDGCRCDGRGGFRRARDRLVRRRLRFSCPVHRGAPTARWRG